MEPAGSKKARSKKQGNEGANITSYFSKAPSSGSRKSNPPSGQEETPSKKAVEVEPKDVGESKEDEVGLDEGMNLRPRKVKNYNAMIDPSGMEDIQDSDVEASLDDEVEVEMPDEDDESSVDLGRNRGRRKQVIEDEEDEEDIEVEACDEEDDEHEEEKKVPKAAVGSKRKLKQAEKGQGKRRDYYKKENDEDKRLLLDNLPDREDELRKMLRDVRAEAKKLEQKFFEEEESDEEEGKQEELSYMQQFWCIPISANVTDFKFDKLGQVQKQLAGRLFDVITMDPPWQLSSSNPTRGVAIAYDTLGDKQILNLPIHHLQENGFLFIWVINAKYRFALTMMETWGYKLVDEIVWVKQTVNGKIAKGHGYYLQHAKETCLVGVKGDVSGLAKSNIKSDVIFSQRRGQSQKPEEIYELAEALIPNGYYLEIFGRRNNLHNGWVTIGNEI